MGRDFVARGAKRIVRLFRKRWSIESALRSGEGVAAAGWSQGQGSGSGVDPRLAEPDLDAGGGCVGCEVGVAWSG